MAKQHIIRITGQQTIDAGIKEPKVVYFAEFTGDKDKSIFTNYIGGSSVVDDYFESVFITGSIAGYLVRPSRINEYLFTDMVSSFIDGTPGNRIGTIKIEILELDGDKPVGDNSEVVGWAILDCAENLNCKADVSLNSTSF